MRFRTAVPSIAVTALLAAGAAAQDCPELVGQWPHQTTSLVTRAGSYAYVAHDDSLRVMDISDPQAPVAVGDLDLTLNVSDLAAIDGYVFVAAGDFVVVDVRNPMLPSVAGTVELWGASAVAVSGGHAYVADSILFSGLRVIDVSTPASPTEVGSVEVLGATATGGGIAVSGDHVFLTWTDPFSTPGAGLKVIDVSTPSAPFEAGSLDLPDDAWGIALWRGHAYVGNSVLGLRVIDVTTPTAPVDLGVVATPGTADAVSISAGYAWVADWLGLRVFDLKIPASPVEIGSYEPTQLLPDVVVQWQHAVATNRDAGMLVFERCWLPVFGDGFESGDLSEWSSGQP